MSAQPEPAICEVPVFYATTEGQTQRIAESLAAALRQRGLDSRPVAIGGPYATKVDWTRVRGALVGASLHMGRHQRAANAFVKAHAAALNEVPSAFFSVSLSAASRNPEEVQAAATIAQSFPASYGWTPALVVSLAGRLAYRQYGFVKRMLMKRIARKEGAPTDTSRDYDMTNWEQVNLLAHDLAGLIHAHGGRRGAGAAA